MEGQTGAGQLPEPLQTAYILQCAQAYGHAFQEAVRLCGYEAVVAILNEVFADGEGGIPGVQYRAGGAESGSAILPADAE